MEIFKPVEFKTFWNLVGMHCSQQISYSPQSTFQLKQVNTYIADFLKTTNISNMNMWMQKTKYSLLALIIFGLLSTFACKTTSLVSVQQISGTWQEKEPSEVMQFAGSGHYIKFNDNKTFQLEQNLWTDMLDSNSPCRANRTDYIKGFYKLKGSTLKLTGTYYEDNTFATVKPNCKNEAEFKKTYQIEINSDGERITLDKNEVQPGMQVLLMKQ